MQGWLCSRCTEVVSGENDPCECTRDAEATIQRLGVEVRDFRTGLATARYVLNTNNESRSQHTLHTPTCQHVAAAIAGHVLPGPPEIWVDHLTHGSPPRALHKYILLRDWPDYDVRRCRVCAPIEGAGAAGPVDELDARRHRSVTG